MAYTLNDLAKTLQNQLYDIVCGGDGKVPPPKDTFLTWCMPGIPMREDSFRFAADGIGTGKDADDEKKLLQQAYNWATLVDFIPSPGEAYTSARQEAIYRPGAQERLSEMYGQILKASKVVHRELTEKQRAKLEKFRGLLRSTRKVTDLITDEEREVTEDGPILREYLDKQAKWMEKALLYNAKRVAAQSATGPEGKAAVMDWAANAELYRLQVKTAMDAWISGGYRNEVDQMNAFINQVTLRDMALWKQKLIEYFDDALLSAMGQGQRFYYTTAIPGDFATAPGWSDHKMNHTHITSSSTSSSNSWTAGAIGQFAGIHFGGAAHGSNSQFDSNYQVSSFSLKFAMTQVIVGRGFMYPEFLTSRGWMLEKGDGWTFDDLPSDGESPPKGKFVAYPTSALFIKDVVIESQEFADALHASRSSIGGGGHIGWGPIALGGTYERSDSNSSYEATINGATITVPGMQIVGFVNHLLGKAPDPLPELKPEDFE